MANVRSSYPSQRECPNADSSQVIDAQMWCSHSIKKTNKAVVMVKLFALMSVNVNTAMPSPKSLDWDKMSEKRRTKKDQAICLDEPSVLIVVSKCSCLMINRSCRDDTWEAKNADPLWNGFYSNWSSLLVWRSCHKHVQYSDLVLWYEATATLSRLFNLSRYC